MAKQQTQTDLQILVKCNVYSYEESIQSSECIHIPTFWTSCQTRGMNYTIKLYCLCCPNLFLTNSRHIIKYITIGQNVVLVHLQVAVGCMLHFSTNSVGIQVGMQCTLLWPNFGDYLVKLVAQFYPRVTGGGPYRPQVM